MPVKVINSLEEFRDIINGDKPVVIDFWATWCGPCRQISPVFEELSHSPDVEGIGFYKLDVDEQAEASQEAGIRAMPTFQCYHKGNKLSEVVGADQAGLRNLISQANAV